MSTQSIIRRHVPPTMLTPDIVTPDSRAFLGVLHFEFGCFIRDLQRDRSRGEDMPRHLPYIPRDDS
jgi:hypothetical protein